jgi:hypothetical protein
MPTINLALVSEVQGHDQSDVARVAAALQRQATRDFGPIWDVQATVDAFPRLLGDPFGRRTIPGKSPKRGQGRVEFLVEVCDPCEAAQFAYTVNDILVSDFYTPHFFDPHAAAGVRYSFTGAITKPRQVLRGGYLSWHEPVSDHWWQELWFGQRRQHRELGVFEAKTESLRAWVDGQTEHPGIDQGLKKSAGALKAAVALGEETAASASSKAEVWRKQIASIKSG